MADLIVAIGLVLVIEGLLYAAFPDRMKKMMSLALSMPDNSMRTGGLFAAASGIIIIWLARWFIG